MLYNRVYFTGSIFDCSEEVISTLVMKEEQTCHFSAAIYVGKVSGYLQSNKSHMLKE